MYLLSDELNSIFVLHPALYQSQSNQHRSSMCMNIHSYVCEIHVCVKITPLYVMCICMFEIWFRNRKIQLLFWSHVQAFSPVKQTRSVIICNKIAKAKGITVPIYVSHLPSPATQWTATQHPGSS